MKNVIRSLYISQQSLFLCEKNIKFNASFKCCSIFYEGGALCIDISVISEMQLKICLWNMENVMRRAWKPV